MHSEQRQQTRALLESKHIQRAIFSRPESIKWLTGVATPVQVGPNLFEASYPLVWYEDGQFTLIILDAYADLAAPFAREADGKVVTYAGYAVETPIASGAHLREQFLSVAKPERGGGVIGVEREFTSDLIAEPLRSAPNANIIAIDGWLEPLRAVKTPEEIEVLRRNIALTDIGHAAVRRAVAPGQREIDIWDAMQSAIEQAAGRRVPIGNDCVVGYRAPNNVGGWPEHYVLRPGDSLIVDISVVLDGYWSDSCGTYYVGERSPLQEKLHRVVSDALALGISLVRPGAVAREIDQQVRAFIAAAGYPVYPHHTGHGIGASGHEAPRITPYNTEILREGMVIMLEPGIYFPGQTGVRLEDAILVTATGADVLTKHNKA